MTIRHDVAAETAVVPFLENEADWEAHREGTLDSLAPVGHLETVLAERVAMLLWRLGRANRYERQLIALKQDTLEETVFKYDPPCTSLTALQCDLNCEQEVIAFIKRLPKMKDTSFTTSNSCNRRA
ncbi:MAG: hypothetical protein WKF74_08535 [Pyrinomonadaceae bacterium]